ncbi:MAG TPA: TonB-dependent receptor family protein, partial [Chitinophagaceae bacterium]|nr:TonB-dependent receptor family protein [Chitinophagaceae bacterium]
ILALFFVLLAFMTIAQPPAGAGNRGNGGQMPTGRFYGKVVDSKTGKPIEYASVQLLQNKMDTVTKKRKETVVAGMLTKANGDFSLENVGVFGPSKLRITVIGFKEFEQTVSFDIKPGGDMSSIINALDKDLGNIKVELDEKVLDNVTVSAARPGLQLGIDRKVFNVDKNIVSAGGTAVDVMRNVPSLNVDIDGNVTMRNNAPQLFVDGRPTNLSLEQIPADAIQSVELITNPSAKFDASGGTSGILNIVLKKEKKVGYNGSLRANLDSRARVGVGGDINLRQQKFNFFANGMYNQRKSISTGTTERENYYTTPDVNILQKDRSTQVGSFGFGRAGIDFFATNRTTFSLAANFVRGQFKPFNTSDIYYDSLYPAIISAYDRRASNTKGDFRNLGSTFSFKHNFPKPGRELTADVTFNRSRNSNASFIQTETFDVPQYDLQKVYRQQQQIRGNNQNFVIQTDFVNPLAEKTKMEMGLRAQLRKTDSRNAFYVEENGEYIIQPGSVSEYESNDQVYAAYATFSSQIKNFGYQLGLRAESSDYEGKLLTTGELFKIDFPISFFPSIFLSQKLSETQSLQLNYSRRINRPNFWQLTPFTDSSDRLNPSKGNPGLKPEFTNSFELSYEKTFKNKGNFLASLYYKHTTDLIIRYQTSESNNGDDVILNSYINANSSIVTGVELTSRNNLTKWWEFTPNLNLYTSDVKIKIPGEPDQPRLTSYFVKINNTFKLPKNFTIQLSGDYQSKTVLPPGGSGGGGGRGGGHFFGGAASSSQGYVRPNYGVDIALRYEFLKNRTASVSLNMNDVFRTRRSDIHSESTFFMQDAFRRRDPQVLRLNFNWRFGKFDASLFKRKNMRNQGESGMDGMNMGQ